MTDLKPCPFCGSADLSPARFSRRYIECNSCKCFGPSVQNKRGLAGSFVQWEIVHASINDAWNSRAHKTTEAAEATTARASGERCDAVGVVSAQSMRHATDD